MPKFRVEWRLTCEWIVEGISEEAVRRAAETTRSCDLDFDGEYIHISDGRLAEGSRVDAVLVGGELLCPEDAKAEVKP